MVAVVKNVYFLGAGQPFSGTNPSPLNITYSGTRVLDWLCKSVSFMKPNILFIAGYEYEKIKYNYPSLKYIYSPDWKNTKAGWSLLYALNNVQIDDPVIVSYSDIIYREKIVRSIVDFDCDIVIAVDSHWLTRFIARNKVDVDRCEKVCVANGFATFLGSNISSDLSNAEFIGLAKFSSAALDALLNLQLRSELNAFFRQSKLSDLVELLRLDGFKVAVFDVQGDWAELNEPKDLSRFIMGTKAQTLNRLRSMVRYSRIEDQICFSFGEWLSNFSVCLQNVKKLNCSSVVVRSSALTEDGFNSSNAGAYTSILNVDTTNITHLKNAIEEVFFSYPDRNLQNEVLVQPMLNNILVSGVVFTRTLTNGAPYYVTNYDDVSGRTDSITNGSSKSHKTLVMRRDTAIDNISIPPNLIALLPALREIESLLGYDSLDVEFAVTVQGDIHILQVRPIAVDHSCWTDANDDRFYKLLLKAEEHFSALQPPNPFVQGKRTIFGIMPDWNPAEIIGKKPGLMAISLYRDLIMDNTWAMQRAEYGYRDVRPQPLLQVFAGHPYVDVRASLNSFIPVNLPDELAGRIVDFCLDWLQANPHLHDKLEFEVIPTCFSLDFDDWHQRFHTQAGLTVEELKQWRDELLGITLNALGRNAGDLAVIESLQHRFNQLENCQLPALSKAFALIEDARHYGALPFAHLARSAFVAVTLLRSAVTTGVLSQDEVDDFLSTIQTVSHAYRRDAEACSRGELTWLTFVDRYGHLRPGTYDITSPSYRQDPERYLRPAVKRSLECKEGYCSKKVAGKLWKNARQRFAYALNASGIPGNADIIESFMRQAIEGREYAKFAFTRNLSSALDALREWGAGYGLNSEVLAQLDIDNLRALQLGQISIDDIPAWLIHLASTANANRDVIDALELPPLLCQHLDFVVFQYPATQANFIGNTSVMAECLDLDSESNVTDLAGRIVLISNADPGYDWLFSRSIVGLITMYGGANSHMAIRAAEFGLPAAIGVGEVSYRSLACAKELELNPINRVIRILH